MKSRLASLITVVSILTMASLFFPIFSTPEAPNMYWSPDLRFRLEKHNSFVEFSEWTTFDYFVWNDVINASEITFYTIDEPTYVLNQPFNLTAVASPVTYNSFNEVLFINSSLGIVNQRFVVGMERLLLGMKYRAIKNGTLWAQGQNNLLWRLTATVSNITGKATIQIYTNGYRPRYVKVGGVYTTEWSYNPISKILTFNATAASSRSVESIYGLSDEETSSMTIFGSLMGALTHFRKKIADYKEKYRKWIEKALIIIFVAAIIFIIVFVFGVYVWRVW